MTPVIDGDRILISEAYGPGSALLRIKPEGFDVLRKDPPRGKSLASHWATPVLLDGYLYGCSGQGSGDAELRAVRYADGKVAWSRSGLGRTTVTAVQGNLIVLGERGRLRVVKATPEGSVEVSATESLVDYPAWNPPALAHGLLYVRGKNRLVAFDLRHHPQEAASAEE